MSYTAGSRRITMAGNGDIVCARACARARVGAPARFFPRARARARERVRVRARVRAGRQGGSYLDVAVLGPEAHRHVLRTAAPPPQKSSKKFKK